MEMQQNRQSLRTLKAFRNIAQGKRLARHPGIRSFYESKPASGR